MIFTFRVFFSLSLIELNFPIYGIIRLELCFKDDYYEK